MNGDIRAGAIDVHAHWLPRDLLALPPGSPLGGMHDRDGELFLGDVPLSFPTAAMTDIDAVVADTLKAGLGARVISAPPFAFPVRRGGRLCRRLQQAARRRRVPHGRTASTRVVAYRLPCFGDPVQVPVEGRRGHGDEEREQGERQQPEGPEQVLRVL